jgi:hypothetical protein
VFGLDHIVLHVTSNAMLRTEQCGEIDPWMSVKKIGGVLESMVYRRLIADKSDSCVTKI